MYSTNNTTANINKTQKKSALMAYSFDQYEVEQLEMVNTTHTNSGKYQMPMRKQINEIEFSEESFISHEDDIMEKEHVKTLE